MGPVLRSRPRPSQHWLEPSQFHFQLGRTEPGPVFKFGIGTILFFFKELKTGFDFSKELDPKQESNLKQYFFT
jgi:hypothetical protein